MYNQENTVKIIRMLRSNLIIINSVTYAYTPSASIFLWAMPVPKSEKILNETTS